MAEGAGVPGGPGPGAEIRRAVAREMERRGVTQVELAERSGVAQPNISRYLAGGEVTTATLGRLMRSLGLVVRSTASEL